METCHNRIVQSSEPVTKRVLLALLHVAIAPIESVWPSHCPTQSNVSAFHTLAVWSFDPLTRNPGWEATARTADEWPAKSLTSLACPSSLKEYIRSKGLFVA